MGGAPVLFLLMAMGITYGWQPDGNGGVEYVIQIPPEQLDELKRSGELSSVINPKVQRHVSRVVVKVGNETLREITPAELNQTAGNSPTSGIRSASHDGSPMPIPEMREAVMKPADGFSLPPTLEEANASAEQARSASSDILSDAGNALRNAVETAIGGGVSGPTQDPRLQNTSNATNPPMFTGADPTGALAQSPQGVPSTATAAQRDRSWYTDGRSPTPSTDPIEYRPTDPRSFVGPPDLRSTVPSSTQNPAPTLPSTDYANQVNRTAGQQPTFGGLGATSTYANPPADLRTNPPDMRTGTPAYNPRASAAPSYGTSTTGQNADTRTTAPRPDVDPRLTNAQVATLPQGAWSIDAYGRPIDRDGRVLDQWGRPIDNRIAANTSSDTRLNQPMGYDLNPKTSTTQPHPNSTVPTGHPGQNNPGHTANVQTAPIYPDPRATLTTSNGTFYPPAATQPSVILQPPQATLTRMEPPFQQATQSDRSSSFTTDRINYGGTASGGASARAESKGPLFNTLLLISGVGNLYLFFWLKNLRYRFRDLVAAKRVMTTNSSVI